MKTKKVNINSAVFSISITVPMLLSIIATHFNSAILGAITIIVVFLLLKIPQFKYRENLWMFVIATFATIPLNITIIKMINDAFFDYYNVASKILGGFVVYAVLFSFEQIMLGLITRFFYRKQYKLFDDFGES